MALKKELSVLYNLLQHKITLLPLKFRSRATTDLNLIFHNYDLTEDISDLEKIKQKAENKLVILEMSQEAAPKIEKIPGFQNFIIKDGRVTEGTSEKKLIPDYSNWYAGNVDPQDLRRHKDLMDRVHYDGPFWEGRPRNMSVLDEVNPQYHDVEPEPHPPESLREEKENAFEAVKR
jgi:hypothetical protein